MAAASSSNGANRFNMSALLKSLSAVTDASERNTVKMQEAAHIMKERMMSRNVKKQISDIQERIRTINGEIKKAQQSIERIMRASKRGPTSEEEEENKRISQTLNQQISELQMELSVLQQDLEKIYKDNKKLLQKKRSTVKKSKNQNQNGNNQANALLANMFDKLSMGGRRTLRKNSTRRRRNSRK